MRATFDGIINEPTTDYLGKDGFFWWFGEVVDNRDPLKIGRVRVRIMGWYTGNNPNFRDEMPDQDLPWAVVLQPTNQAGVGSTGESAGQLQQGAMVMGFFLDGQEAQSPVVMGVVRATKTQATEAGLIQGITGQKYTDAHEPNKAITGTDQTVTGPPGPATENTAAPGTQQVANASNIMQAIGNQTHVTTATPEANANDSNFEKHLEAMFGDLAYTVSHLVPSGGDFLNVIDGTITNIDALIGKAKNLIMGIFSEALAGIKELFLQQISKALKAIRLFGKTGLPLIVTAAIQAIIQLVLQYICSIDGSWLRAALDIITNFEGFILGLVGQALDSIISMLNNAYSSLVNSIICAINNAYNTIRSIISAIKAAVAVAKVVADIIKKGTAFFENLEKLDLNSIQSITSIISLILGLLLTQCDRTVPVDNLHVFVPFMGSTPCSVGTTGGSGPGQCNSGGSGIASLNAAANLLQSVVKAADPFRTAVKTASSGYAEAQLGTPGKYATITRYPSGAQHRSIRENSETYQNYMREMERQKKNPKSDPRAYQEGDPNKTIIGDDFVFPGAASYTYQKDHAVINKAKFVQTVDGDYKLKVAGNMDIEIEGRLAIHTKNAPMISGNTGVPTGVPLKQSKNMILFDGDTEISSRGKLETQGVGAATIAKPGTDVKIVSDNLNLNAPSLNINCTNDLKLCAGNAIYVETPSLVRMINLPPLPRAKSGIFTIMHGSYDMLLLPGLSGADAVPRFTVNNTVGPLWLTSNLNMKFTCLAGAFIQTCATGAFSISATSGPMAIFSGSTLNITASAIMTLTAATIKLN
jgi:hypothetical protein